MRRMTTLGLGLRCWAWAGPGQGLGWAKAMRGQGGARRQRQVQAGAGQVQRPGQGRAARAARQVQRMRGPVRAKWVHRRHRTSGHPAYRTVGQDAPWSAVTIGQPRPIAQGGACPGQATTAPPRNGGKSHAAKIRQPRPVAPGSRLGSRPVRTGHAGNSRQGDPLPTTGVLRRVDPAFSPPVHAWARFAGGRHRGFGPRPAGLLDRRATNRALIGSAGRRGACPQRRPPPTGCTAGPSTARRSHPSVHRPPVARPSH